MLVMATTSQFHAYVPLPISSHCGSVSSNEKLICPERSQKKTYRDLGRVEELEAKVVCFHEVQVVHDLIKQVLAFGMFLESKWIDEDLGHDSRVRNKKVILKITFLCILHIYVCDTGCKILKFLIGCSMIQTHD